MSHQSPISIGTVILFRSTILTNETSLQNNLSVKFLLEYAFLLGKILRNWHTAITIQYGQYVFHSILDGTVI